MAELILIRQGDSLRPLSAEDLEILRKFPNGKPLRGKVTSMRNYAFHKKAFSMMSLSFQYWVPKSYITQIEKKTVENLFKFLVKRGVEPESTRVLCHEYLNYLNANRSQMENLVRSFDSFRDWLTVEAGFYEEVITPAGPKRIPKSISFSSMDDSEFGEFYKSAFDVCWHLCLSANFKTPREAEAAAEQLLGYA